MNGNLVGAIYAVPSDRTNLRTFADAEPWIRKDIDLIDSILDVSSGPRLDQDVRWECVTGRVYVQHVELPIAVGDDREITMLEITDYLRSRPEFSNEKFKYVVWLQMKDTDFFKCGGVSAAGCGEMSEQDTRQDPSLNENNALKTGYSVSRVLTGGAGDTTMQELWHTLGAVLNAAPGSDNGGHTLDAFDVMNAIGHGGHRDCTSGLNTLDCEKDTYYSALCVVNASRCPKRLGGSGSDAFLASSWNTARSYWLTDLVTTPDVGWECGGMATDFNGDERHDEFGGLSKDDVWYLGDGHDDVRSGTGDDRVCGANGPDRLHGKGGADLLRGGYGDDVIFDGYGTDAINGGTGYDVWYMCADGDEDNWVSDGESKIEKRFGPSPDYC